jgi:hypothetical protein
MAVILIVEDDSFIREVAVMMIQDQGHETLSASDVDERSLRKVFDPQVFERNAECGAMIRDSTDGARFYLSAYVIEGKVAMVSFGDSGDAHLLTRTREDLLRRFGPARSYPTKLEWKTGVRVATFTWRGKGAARWFYINLRDDVLLQGTSPYAKRPKS